MDFLQETSDNDLGQSLAHIADQLLDSARGNSGAILAQFFQGISDATGEKKQLKPSDFAHAVAMGSDYAHDAISKPREGTILSVIAAFSAAVTALAIDQRETDFRVILSSAKITVDEALVATQQQLEVLRKAGVVDAGAKGFAELLGGFTAYICDGVTEVLPERFLRRSAESMQGYGEVDSSAKYQYCTECLVTGVDIDRRKLREALDKLGDSLVLAGTKRKAKIHIHVDSPEQVFDVARTFGDLSQEKADDMRRQQQSTHAKKRQFAVVTDSAADISDAELEHLDIHMVPCRIQFGERGYLDKLSISTDEFYAELQSNPSHPTTSQPAPGDLRRQFQFLASHYDDVISINLSSKASGTYAAAKAAAARTTANGRIHVIDSRNASVGQGQLVVLAAKCAATGHEAAQTLATIEQLVEKTTTFALLSRLDYAVRGGRVPGWVKAIASLLNLTPILRIVDDGKVGLGGFLFGRRNGMSKFAAFVATRSPRDENIDVRIAHAICLDDAQELAALLRNRLSHIRSIEICELGTAIGVHGGPGTLVVSTLQSTSADDFPIDID